MMSKVALITGAGKRIGAAIAHKLHDANMRVIIHARDSQKEARELCQLFNKKRYNSALCLFADLTKISDCQQLIQEAEKKWQRLDILINNASLFLKTSSEKINECEWDEMMNCNLKAPFFLSMTAFPFLKKQQGTIINIADIHAEKPLKDYSIYSISQAGLVMLTKSLAKELGPDVRVNAIAPGAILWPEKENALRSDIKNKIIQETVLKRHGSPEDIAQAVLYFSNHAGYVTGQILKVDGGRSL